MNFFSQYAQKASEFLNVEKANELVERAKAAAMDAAEAASNLSETVQAEYRRTFVELDCTIYNVRPDLLVMEFPDEEKINRLATRLNTDHGQRMLILNMSERKYDTSKFQGEVVDVAFRGLPAPPLEMLFELCLSCHRWLASDPGNVIVVHCFQNHSRSVVFASCFLAFRGIYPHPVDALHDVCKKLHIDDTATIIPSQRRYLTYFQQCQSGFAPTRSRSRLVRVQMKHVPVFEVESSVALRPYIEVWNHGELVHSSLPVWHTSRGSGDGVTTESGAGDGPTTLPPAVGVDEPSVFFQLGCVVHGDVLLRIRHVFQNGNRDTVCRLAFHTALVPQGFQFRKNELDGACDDARVSDECFVDLTFEPVSEESGAATDIPSPVFSKARDLSARLLVEEQERRRRQEAEEEEQQRAAEEDRRKRMEATTAAGGAAAGAPSSSALGERDEFEELEATLLRGGGGGGGAGASPAPPSTAPGAARAPSSGDDHAAAELRRALAEATADDSPAAATSAGGKSGGGGGGGGGGGYSGAAAPVASPAVAKDASATSAPSAAKAQDPSAAASSPVEKKEEDKVGDDIDALFGEFDAALEFAGGPVLGKGEASASEAIASKASAPALAPKAAAGAAAPAATAAAPAAASASATKETDDIFGDVDAFLKELDA